MVIINNDSQNSIEFAVPRLQNKTSPAEVTSISLYKSGDTQVSMRIVIKRRLDIPLESLTFKYRFSALPLDEPDSRHAYHSYVYTDDDLNQKEQLIFNGSVPSKMKLEGCTAYISELHLSDGQVFTFSPSDYMDKTEPLPMYEEPSIPVSTDRSVDEQAKTAQTLAKKKTEPINSTKSTKPDSSQRRNVRPRKKKKMRRGVLAALLTVFFFVIIGETIIGVFLYKYSDVKSSAKQLTSEHRYNEAYKLLLDNEYNNLLQSVCEEAAAYYAEAGDYEEAYVYSMAAPIKFDDDIIELAATNVITPATGEINENAYRVAKIATDDSTFSSIVHSMIDILIEKEDYPNALRVASELRYENDRDKTENEIFAHAIDHFLTNHKFEKLINFIDELAEVDNFTVSDSEVTDAIIAHCTETGDSSGLIYFSSKYPDFIDASSVDVTVEPDDPGVRAALEVIWPLLSEEQKRIYHSHEIALYKEQFIIKNGRIEGTDITDAVSVDTYEYHTIVLHKDGSVSAIPNEKHNIAETFPKTNDVIQIAAGLSHSVMLHADGTVTAIGDNTYGQCNVSSWTDIVAIAAGQNFTLGLKMDGTLAACGSNACGQCDIHQYRNCVAIAAGSQTAVMLFSDGTIRLQGYCSLGLKDAETVDDAVSIRAGSVAIIVEHSDGSYSLFSGLESGSFGNTSSWRDIADYDVGSVCIGAVGNNGSIYSGGDNHPDR